jgi:Fe-Mn family superoxide dismutase
MEIHHDKHHNAYVTNLNAAAERQGLPRAKYRRPLAPTLKGSGRQLNSRPQHCGGQPNHSMFWTIMGPKGGGKPGGDVGESDR